ncbi:hypothetical protein ACHAW5_000657 [Stephanodiscus triporus]|uniref:Uncharacterized protein n=1 Tax=Stephanodiscus triporus TaxID=2934178 RepID=A0ABD3N0I8_9STRA
MAASSLSNDTTDASSPSGENPDDLDVFVKELMENSRIDDMGAKIDELEKSLTELMDQAGVESTASDGLEKSDAKGIPTVKRSLN